MLSGFFFFFQLFFRLTHNKQVVVAGENEKKKSIQNFELRGQQTFNFSLRVEEGFVLCEREKKWKITDESNASAHTITRQITEQLGQTQRQKIQEEVTKNQNGVSIRQRTPRQPQHSSIYIAKVGAFEMRCSSVV